MKNVIALLLSFFVLTSHELFLKTDSYFLLENSTAELYLFNGTFDKSENIITRDRIVNARIIGPGYRFLPSETDYYDKDSVTYLKFNSGKAGTYTAGISTLPRTIELSGQDFEDYLIHEGLKDVISERKKKGKSYMPAREKYSKHVKTILQVGSHRSDHFKTNLGYPIEFIPLTNPYDIKKGDRLTFLLIKGGKPLFNQMVHYSAQSTEQKHKIEERSTRTDMDGTFTIQIDRSGKWYVATIHMTESEEPGLDYESNWATLTFGVR